MTTDATATLSDVIRDALREAIRSQSIRSVADATGVPHPSLIRFLRREQSLRLDKADKLAAYLGIEATRRPKGRKE
ncbi:MAG TPA: helix-turn-helix transcriptional regulator [Planctomycetota bacterium]|nr:helix-turn-helix transcriptional regulator [Planctomycetota bacterium]HRR80521.1 helix-turn-helix transcriptional regulator [Planctomycetota bacterium]